MSDGHDARRCRETGVDGVVRRDIGEGVVIHRADRHTVYEHNSNLISGISMNQECLIAAARDGDRAGRIDRAVGAGSRGDGVVVIVVRNRR